MTDRAHIEECLVCCCMLEETGLVADYCIESGATDHWFNSLESGQIWRTIVTLRAESSAVDETAVMMRLIDGKSFNAPEFSRIAGLLDGWQFNYKKLFDQLRGMFSSDCVTRAAGVMLEAMNNGTPHDEAVGEFNSSIQVLDETEKEMTSASVFIPESLQALRSGGKDGQGLMTGFSELDGLMRMAKQQLIVMAARPTMGKTSIALNIMEYLAVEHGEPVAMFNMEMTEHELGQRMISAKADVSMQRMAEGNMNSFEVDSAASKIQKAPIWIYDRKGQTVAQIATRCRRLKNKGGLSLIVIDYLGLIRPTTNYNSRREQVDEISRNLKELAGSIDCPVFVCAQFNRDLEKTARKPRLDDLRDSGAIEQDADIVLALYEKEKDRKDERTGATIRDLAILKNRKGTTGDIELLFYKQWTKFKSK